jgi:hypothetical protein
MHEPWPTERGLSLAGRPTQHVRSPRHHQSQSRHPWQHPGVLQTSLQWQGLMSGGRVRRQPHSRPSSRRGLHRHDLQAPFTG